VAFILQDENTAGRSSEIGFNREKLPVEPHGQACSIRLTPMWGDISRPMSGQADQRFAHIHLPVSKALASRRGEGLFCLLRHKKCGFGKAKVEAKS
jgi:hypothetical protein